jgi:hypothetical protein
LSFREESVMEFNLSICLLMFALTFAAAGFGQSSNESGDQSSSPPTGTAAVPAAGTAGSPINSDENPPISGLDQPSLESRILNRSFLQPGLHASQALDTNIESEVGRTRIEGVTRLLGSLTLQKLASRSVLALDYIGGVALYSNRSLGSNQIQQLDFSDRLQWRTGYVTFRDSFSYLPEGSFGYGSYGGTGLTLGTGFGGIGTGLPGGGLGAFFGGGQFAALGQIPRINNTSVVDITQALSRRSAVTLAGAFSIVHFSDNPQGFINSQQVSGQAGYSYEISRKNQVALVYGYQAFRYPAAVGLNFNSHVINVLFGHRISGRMDLVLGAGPQLTHIDSVLSGVSDSWSASGRATLRYRFKLATAELSYHHYNTSGSGFFGGSESDIARIGLRRSFGRRWEGRADIGYTHNSRLAPTLLGGLSADSFNYVFAGAALQRHFSRTFDGYISYQYNDLMFNSATGPPCVPIGPCDRSALRHVATIGVDWRPRPIRLD